MEDKDGIEAFHLFFNALEWARFTSLPYLHREEQEREDQPALDAFEALTFFDDDVTLEVLEMPTGDVIRLEMSDAKTSRGTELFMDLNRGQWEFLCSLNYVVEPQPEATDPRESSKTTAPIPFPLGQDVH
jgi:hypothetical protein